MLFNVDLPEAVKIVYGDGPQAGAAPIDTARFKMSLGTRVSFIIATDAQESSMALQFSASSDAAGTGAELLAINEHFIIYSHDSTTGVGQKHEVATGDIGGDTLNIPAAALADSSATQLVVSVDAAEMPEEKPYLKATTTGNTSGVSVCLPVITGTIEQGSYRLDALS